MCKVNYNQEKNGIELSFENKPAAAVLDSIKAQGFRWNRATRVWYAKTTPERVDFASSLTDDNISIETTAKTSAPAEIINLDGVGHKVKQCYGAEFAAVIRAELKERGVKGVTIKNNRGGWTDSYTVTIKAAADDIASIEEAKIRFTRSDFFEAINRGVYVDNHNYYYKDYEAMSEDDRAALYDKYIRKELTRLYFNNYHHDKRNDYWKMTTAFFNKVCAVFDIVNQWNYDNSDIYTDYHDVGYYLDIDIKAPADFTPRENMTENERRTYDEEIENERRAAEEWEKEREKERAAAEEARKKYEEDRAAVVNEVLNNIRIEDLDDNEALFVDNLRGGIGKECSLDELKQENRDALPAVITRKVIFSDEKIYQDFGRFLLEDWVFVAGMGGSTSEDVRLDNVDYYTLTDKQRESIVWYNTKCVGVYVNDVLRLVIDPQGYNYPRYCFLADEATIKPAAAERERLRKMSEALPAFYIPAPVKDQVNNIKEGDAITIYQCDGWNLNSIEGGRGIVTGIYEGSYAQYQGVYIELAHGRKTSRAFIRDHKNTLIYKGIKDKLPDSITKRRVNDNMYELLMADEIMPQLLNYYEDAPLIDTMRR